MAKFIPDIMSKRWVIVSPIRSNRPNGNLKKRAVFKCPFCEGHEKETPPEVLRMGGGEANKKGWKLRIVPNKFPITDIHEVIIHSPDDEHDLEDLSLAQVGMVLFAYRERYNFYRKKGQVLIFCNHGEHAGASLKHPHSQLVVIPSQINLDTLSREPLTNMIMNNKYFNVHCPDFSQWPYEVWIVPKKENTVFGDLDDKELTDLAEIFKRTLRAIKKVYDSKQFGHIPFAYNYYIYHKENWYLRIIPRFVHRAGFELGTGLSVNVTDPYEAAMELKGLEDRMAKVLHRLKPLIRK